MEVPAARWVTTAKHEVCISVQKGQRTTGVIMRRRSEEQRPWHRQYGVSSASAKVMHTVLYVAKGHTVGVIMGWRIEEPAVAAELLGRMAAVIVRRQQRRPPALYLN